MYLANKNLFQYDNALNDRVSFMGNPETKFIEKQIIMTILSIDFLKNLLTTTITNKCEQSQIINSPEVCQNVEVKFN